MAYSILIFFFNAFCDLFGKRGKRPPSLAREELGVEAGVAYAARSPSLARLHALEPAVVEAWARGQALRLEPESQVIKTLPWWYPVHPVAIAYFMEQGWWALRHVNAHAVLTFYSMTRTRFGGEWGTFHRHADYVEFDTDDVIDWCVQFITRFDLAPEFKASFLGHTYCVVGEQLWLERVLPACSGHMAGVELDVLFAAAKLPRPHAIALEMTAELDDGLRHAGPPEPIRSGHVDEEEGPFFLPESHPHFPLRYLLAQEAVWSDFMLYKVGVYLKRLEGSEVESFAIPDGV